MAANPYADRFVPPEQRGADLSDRIPGWGADLPRENRPAVPMEAAPPNGTGAHWDIPPQQPETVRIFKSTEHMRMTPTFGTSCPPRGLSGAMRAFAYRYSEGRLLHWMTLLAADRVDVVEGAIGDVLHLRGPRPFKEMGLAAERRPHPARRAKASIAANVVVFGAIAAAVVAIVALAIDD